MTSSTGSVAGLPDVSDDHFGLGWWNKLAGDRY